MKARFDTTCECCKSPITPGTASSGSMVDSGSPPTSPDTSSSGAAGQYPRLMNDDEQWRRWSPAAQEKALLGLQRLTDKPWKPFYCDKVACNGKPHGKWDFRTDAPTSTPGRRRLAHGSSPGAWCREDHYWLPMDEPDHQVVPTHRPRRADWPRRPRHHDRGEALALDTSSPALTAGRRWAHCAPGIKCSLAMGRSVASSRLSPC